MEFKLSDKGEKFIKRWEELKLRLYADISKNPTIGWGHKFDLGSCDRACPEVITEDQAEAYFKEDVAHVENCLNKNFTDKEFTFDQASIDALICFIFNIGTTAFLNSHVCGFLLKGVEQGDLIYSATEYWAKWCHARNAVTHNEEIVPGLVLRRAAEVRLFLNGFYE